MDSKISKLSRSSISGIISFIVNILLAMLLMPVIISSLGQEDYGLWILVGTFIGYYWLVDLGLASAVERHLSRSIGNGNIKEGNIVINTALFLYSIAGLLVLILTIFFAFFIVDIIKTIHNPELFRYVLFVMGLNLALSFPMRVFSGILRAKLRNDIINNVLIIKVIVRSIVIYVMLTSGYGILWLAIIMTASDLLERLVFLIFSSCIFREMKFSIKLIRKDRIPTLYNYSIYAFMIRIAAQLRFNIDNFVIAAFLGLSSVTIYSIASRLIKYFEQFIVVAVGFFLPLFSEYEGRDDYAAIQQKFLFIIKINNYFALIIGSVLVIFGKVFIIRWVGEEFIRSYYILLIVLIPSTLAYMQQTITNVLLGISKHKFFSIVSLSEGVMNVILSLILVRSFGLIGIALGTAIPLLIVNAFILPVHICRKLNISIKYYYFNILAKSISIILVTSGAFYLLVDSFIKAEIAGIILLSTLLMLLLAAASYTLGFDKLEKRTLLSGLISLLPKRAVDLFKIQKLEKSLSKGY